MQVKIKGVTTRNGYTLTHKRKGRYNNMTVKLLKPYKGFEIEKSYEENADGTIKKDTIVYTAYADDEDNALFDAARTLSELKKKIDIYLR